MPTYRNRLRAALRCMRVLPCLIMGLVAHPSSAQDDRSNLFQRDGWSNINERRNAGFGSYDHDRFSYRDGGYRYSSSFPGSAASGFYGRSGSWNLDAPLFSDGYYHSRSYANPHTWSFAAPGPYLGSGLGTILILPAAPESTRRSEQAPPNVVPGAEATLGILNDPASGGPVRFLLDGERYTLRAGETLLLPDDRPWPVEFFASGTRELRQFSVTDGLYKFKVVDGAWGLFKSKDPVPQPRARESLEPPANDVPANPMGDPVETGPAVQPDAIESAPQPVPQRANESPRDGGTNSGTGEPSSH